MTTKLKGVAACHPDYDVFLGKWRKVRLACAGEDEIKAAGSMILPIPEGMDTYRDAQGLLLGSRQPTSEFDDYVNRACYYEATGRTVLGLTGIVLATPPEVKYPGGKTALENVTAMGKSLDVLIADTLKDNVSLGRMALLVDAAAEETDEPAPYIAKYDAEKVVNWRTRMMDGRETKVMVTLCEQYEPVDADFEHEMKERRRVLRFGIPIFTGMAIADMSEEERTVFGDADGKVVEAPTWEELLAFYRLAASDLSEPLYWQELWEIDASDTVVTEANKGTAYEKAETRWVLTQRIFPRMKGGKLWREMPCEIVNSDGLDVKPSNPPILGLANVNISHYKNSADLEWGLHFTALPTAWAAGFKMTPDPGAPGSKPKLTIGSAIAWVSDDAQAHCGYLEFTGAGLGSIRETMATKKDEMAALGARMLEQQKAGVESAESVRLRQAGEKSVLATIAQTTSEALTNALKWLAMWQGHGEEPSVEVKLNEDFEIVVIDPAMMQQLMLSLQAGLLSFDVWYHNLKRGKIYPEGWTMEQEESAIDAGLPTGATPIPKSPDDRDIDHEEADLQMERTLTQEEERMKIAAKNAPEGAAAKPNPFAKKGA